MTMTTKSATVVLPAIAALAVIVLPPFAHADDDKVRVTRAETVGMSTDRLERIGARMRRMIDEDKIPGTVTLVARRGKVVHFEANGRRNVAANLPTQKNTIFRLYSQSKPVTGAAVMILFEEGHFLLSDPISTSPYRKLPALEMGGSGLVGTVGDYLRCAQMPLNKGEYNGKRILGRKTVEFMTSNHLTPDFPDDPLSSLFGRRSRTKAWGLGFGVTGSVVTNPATAGLPVSRGTYSWGGAAATHFWIDHEEDLLGRVHTQLLPDGTYPVRQFMQLLTYEAIVD